MVEGYRCIAADPPWLERGGGGRGAQEHYSLLRTPEIVRVMLYAPSWRPAANCHLWLWATMGHLPAALSVMDALGFRYVTHAAWIKDRIGLGRYLRGQHELLLLGTRGDATMPPVAPSSVIVAPRGGHSEKPAAAYTVIEAVSMGPRLEMFARAARPGWDVWGNEVNDGG